MNTGVLWPDLFEAESRVLEIQTKLHRWVGDDPGRRFDDLFNLVCDPAFLVVAWDRVQGNRGARSAGVDGVAPRSIVFGSGAFLVGLRDDLKARRFAPMPVREKLIPKKGGKLRGLGIPTARDRTVQAALKLVLEPIFEADFKPCSYGFRPKRRAQDAIEEIFFYGTHYYQWVLEGDIKSCFDEIDHTALMGRVRRRVGDKRVLALVKAFLKAGILGEDQVLRDTSTGTPQGGILSPLLANIALSVLDEHFVGQWESWGGQKGRARRRRQGLANYRLVRYADDFVVMLTGTRAPVRPHYWASDLLEAEGARVHLVHPLGLHWDSRRVKNDVKDATELANRLRRDDLPEAWIAPPEVRELRELVRFRAKLVAVRTSAKAQIHAVMAKLGIVPPLTEMFGPAGQKVLDEMDFPSHYGLRVESLRDLLELYDRELAMVEREIHRELKDHVGYRAIQTLTGVGPITAAIFVAEIGDVSRFRSARHLCSWAGMTPKLHESDTHSHRGGITKQGSTIVRWAAVEAVTRHHGGEPIAPAYRRIAERRGNKIARVAAARRLLTLVYYGLRDGEIRCLLREAA